MEFRFVVLVTIALVAAMIAAVSAQNGVARLDQMGGISDNKVTIPLVDTDTLSARSVTLQRLRSRQGSFSINSAGPVRIDTQDKTEVETGEQFVLSTPASGDVDIHGDDVSVSGTNFLSGSFEQTTIDAGEDVQFNARDSPFSITAFLNAEMSALNDISVESVDSDITVKPEGEALFDTPVMTIGVGDPLEGEGAQIGGDDVRFDASADFTVNGLSNVKIVGRSEVSFTSDVADVEVESTKTLTLTAGTNVDLDSQGDMEFESLFGSVVLDSASSARFKGASAHFKGGDNVTLTTPSDVTIDARGLVKIQDGGAHQTILNSTSFEWTATTINVNSAIKSTLTVGSTISVVAPLISLKSDEGKAQGSIAGNKVDLIGKTTFVYGNNIFISKKSAGGKITSTANVTDHDIIVGNQRVDGDLNLSDGQLKVTGNTIATKSTVGDLEIQARNKLSSQIPGSFDIASQGSVVFTGHEDLDFNAGTGSMSFTAVDIELKADEGNIIYDSPVTTLTTKNQAAFNGNSVLGVDSKSVTFKTDGTAATHISIQGWQTNVKSGPNKDITLTTAANNKVTFTALKNKQSTIRSKIGDEFKVTAQGTFTLSGGSIDYHSDDEGDSDFVLLKATAANAIPVNSNGALLESYESSVTMSTTNGDFLMTSDDLFTKTGRSTVTSTDGSLRLNAAQTQTIISEGKVRIISSKQDVISTTGGSTSFTADSQRAALARFEATDKFVHTLANDLTVRGGSVTGTVTNNNLDVIAQGHIETSSIADTTYSSARLATYLSPNNQTSAHAGNDLTITTVDDLLFKSGRHLHIVGDSHLHNVVLDAKTDNTLQVTADSTFETFNFRANAFGDGAKGLATNTGATMDFSSSQRIDILSGGDIFVNAPAINIAAKNRWDIIGAFSMITDPKPNTAVLDVQACAGDMFIGQSGKLSITTPQDIVVVRGTVCNQTGTDSFPMTVNANNGNLLMQSKLTVFRGPQSVNIRGGEVEFFSTRVNHPEGDIRFISANGISIRELGGEIDVDHGPRANKLAALAGRLDMASAGGQFFRSTGIETNAVFQDYGILLETSSTNTKNFEVNVGDGSLLVNAGDGIRIATTTDTDFKRVIGLQDVHLNATKDILFRTALRGFRMDASGALDAATEGLVNTGVAFHADTGDIYVRSFLAGFIASGFKGTQVLSQLGDIFYNASQSIEHVTDVVDRAQIQYHAPAGDISVKANVNVALQAGTEQLEGDLTMRAHRDITFLSGQTQRFHQSGPTSRTSQNAISLRSLQGDIRVNAGTDNHVFAAGHATFDALVGGQTITANNFIDFISDGARVNIRSAYDTNYEAVDGDLTATANGGGGSLTVISDDNQDIIATAGRNIGYRSSESSNFAAFTDISMITLKNDWTLANDGNTVVHSGGKIFLQSLGQRTAPSDGIFYTGEDIALRTEVDTLIDAARFTLGQTSTGSLATDPVLNINAGGDERVDGFVVDSQGDIKHGTAKTSSIEFRGRAVDLDAVGSISMNTNGPISYNNTGLDAAGFMTIDAFNGDFHLFGGEVAELWAHNRAYASTFRKMTLQATGSQATDGFEFDAARDMHVSAPLEYNVHMRKAESDLRDLDAEAVNLVTITNTDGDRGTLVFDSDFFFRAKGRTVALQTESAGRLFARSRGPFSDVIIHAQDPNANPQANIDIHAAETLTLLGREVDIDGRLSLTIDAPGSGAEIMASDLVEVSANNSLTLTTVKTLSVDAGDGNPAIKNDVLFSIVSSGTTSAKSVGDIQLVTVALESDLEIKADRDIIIENEVNAVLHKRGTVHVEVGRDLLAESGDDGLVYSQGDLIMTHAGWVDLTADQGLTISSTEPLASKMFIQSNGGSTNFDSRGFATNFVAGSAAVASNIHYRAQKAISWISKDEGHRGLLLNAAKNIEVTTTTTQAYTGSQVTFQSGGSTSVISRAAATPAISIETNHLGGDILFAASDDLIFDASASLTISHITADLPTQFSEAGFLFESDGAGSSHGIQMNTTGVNSDIKFTAASSAIRIRSVDNTAILADAVTMIPGFGGFSVRVTGKEERVQTDESDRRGIFIEADQTLGFAAKADISLRSAGGVVSVSGSERVNIGGARTVSVEVDSTDLLRVTSGYKASINAPFAKRDGILLETTDANTNINIVTERRDVRFVAQDASFSGTSSVVLRSESGGEGKVTLLSNGGFRGDIGGSATIAAHGGVVFKGTTNIDLTGDTANVQSSHGITVQTTGPASNLDISTKLDQTVTFQSHSMRIHAPDSFVDFQPRGANDNINGLAAPVQILKVPIGEHTARDLDRFWAIPQHATYEFDEHETPGCVERQMNVDGQTANPSICVCDHNKWRCIRV